MTLHQRDMFSGSWGCLLTVLTAGLFLPIWFFLMLLDGFRKFRCQDCGGT